MAASRKLWQYAHSATILFSVLLFTAGFLCVLLWTNNIVVTETGASPPATSTFTQFSPTVSTFSLTYGVALFGIIWNSLLFVCLLVLERDALPISTPKLRYEIEKSACIVAVVGNTVYFMACISLMAVLAQLAADAESPSHADGLSGDAVKMVTDAGGNRRAGEGATAAMAGFAGATAMWAAFMDVLHALSSSHRAAVKDKPVRDAGDTVKRA